MNDDDIDERTVFVGGLDERVTQRLLEELFTQIATVERVKLPQSQSSISNRYAFIEFHDVESVPFAIEMLDGVKLFGRRIRVERSGHARQHNNQPNPPHRHERPRPSASENRRELSYADERRRGETPRRDHPHTHHAYRDEHDHRDHRREGEGGRRSDEQGRRSRR